MLARLFEEKTIEELPREFFSVACDLLNGALVVCRRGFVYEAVGTSMNLPGVFPPLARARTGPVFYAASWVGLSHRTGQRSAQTIPGFLRSSVCMRWWRPTWPTCPRRSCNRCATCRRSRWPRCIACFRSRCRREARRSSPVSPTALAAPQARSSLAGLGRRLVRPWPFRHLPSRRSWARVLHGG